MLPTHTSKIRLPKNVESWKWGSRKQRRNRERRTLAMFGFVVLNVM